MRVCKACGRRAVAHRKHWYCAACRPGMLELQRRRRGQRAVSAAEAGYDAAHQRERRRLKAIVDVVGAVCARCGGFIAPGEPWDLGHDDFDRSRYRGPEHRACNRATAGRHKRRSVPRTTSRVW